MKKHIKNAQMAVAAVAAMTLVQSGQAQSADALLDKLESDNQVIYRYCDEQGNITAAANPIGALRNIAGIANAQRNVFGMMPHPERASSEALGNTDGRIIINALIMNSNIGSARTAGALVNF